jgi:hypothetical protein
VAVDDIPDDIKTVLPRKADVREQPFEAIEAPV